MSVNALENLVNDKGGFLISEKKIYFNKRYLVNWLATGLGVG